MKPIAILLADLADRGQLDAVRAITKKHGADFGATWRDVRHYAESARARAETWAHFCTIRSADREKIYSVAAVARLFGVDHTTVLAAVKRRNLAHGAAVSSPAAAPCPEIPPCETT